MVRVQKVKVAWLGKPSKIAFSSHDRCLPSQMTGLNAFFSLLKVDIPYQKMIVYIYNHFGLYRKTVSLICSLCLCVMGIPLYMQHGPALYGVR